MCKFRCFLRIILKCVKFQTECLLKIMNKFKLVPQVIIQIEKHVVDYDWKLNLFEIIKIKLPGLFLLCSTSYTFFYSFPFRYVGICALRKCMWIDEDYSKQLWFTNDDGCPLKSPYRRRIYYTLRWCGQNPRYWALSKRQSRIVRWVLWRWTIIHLVRKLP